MSSCGLGSCREPNHCRWLYCHFLSEGRPRGAVLGDYFSRHCLDSQRRLGHRSSQGAGKSVCCCFLSPFRVCRPTWIVAVREHNVGIGTCVVIHRACITVSDNISPIFEQSPSSPEVQIVHRALLISHVNVEREQVDWGESPPSQNLEESGQPISLLHLHLRLCVCVRHVARSAGV